LGVRNKTQLLLIQTQQPHYKQSQAVAPADVTPVRLLAVIGTQQAAQQVSIVNIAAAQ
jgi:hypothetical protein